MHSNTFTMIHIIIVTIKFKEVHVHAIIITTNSRIIEITGCTCNTTGEKGRRREGNKKKDKPNDKLRTRLIINLIKTINIVWGITYY